MTTGAISALRILLLAALPFAAAGAQEVLIEEIIVRAQKRDQNIQDVPVAVTAVSGQTIKDSGIKDIRELTTIAPGLVSNQSQNSTTSSFSIRGIGTSSQNFGLESSVGLYVDGVYRARQSAVINNLVDVAAVEILRGPQGTLFGKNTPSGAILLQTVRPTHETNAFVEVTAGDYGLLNVAAAGNLSLIPDELALRATVFSGRRDGFVSDIALGADTVNDRERAGGRLQLAWTPSDRLDLRVIADYAELNETCCATLTRQDNIVAFGRTGPGGTPIPGSDALLLALGGTVFSGDDFENYELALNRLPHSSNNDWGLSFELNYEFDNATLTSITAWREFTTFDNYDADFSDVDILTDTNAAEQEAFSQELRLTGTVGDRVNYVAGIYYFGQDLNNVSTLDMGPATNAFLTANPQLAQAIAAINLFSPPFPPVATAFPANAFATDAMRQEHESVAIFAQADFELNEDWLLTAGLRYTDEDKDLVGNFLNSPLGPAPDLVAIATVLTQIQMGQLDPTNPANAPLLIATFGPTWVPGWGLYTQPALAPQAALTETLTDDQVTGTIKLSWFASDDAMFYLSYGTGYKSGGTNTDRINPIFSQVFGAETSESIELGVKADFPAQNLRLNVALHNTQVEDLQATAFTGNGFNLQNAGNADTYGGEIELWWSPNEHFDLQSYFVHTTADYEQFANGTCWRATPFHTGNPDPGFDASSGPFDPTASVCDRSGDRISSNPENTFFLAGTYHFNPGGDISGYLRAEYQYLSDTMTDGNNDPLKLRPSFDFLHLKAGLYFENIDAELSIWGRNVTDEAFYETVFDVPVQDGKLNAYPHEPRTWGVTFRKNFQ